jgi:phosphatidylglycerophosphate synthase
MVAPEHTQSRLFGQGTPAGTWIALVAGAGLWITLGALIAASTGLGNLFVAVSLIVYGAVSFVVAVRIGEHHPAAVFGWPNAVTLARAIATALVAGYAAESLAGQPSSDPLAWSFAILAAASIAADGLDGWLARRRGPATAFGARFDMEIDALMILVLAVLAFALGKAGGWVIAIGALRYGFVAAAWVFPWLDGPLPPSFRRKLVCVIQGAALCILVVPPVGPAGGAGLAALALASLVWSFAVDVLWLYRQRGAR